jgi:hypothetical protein
MVATLRYFSGQKLASKEKSRPEILIYIQGIFPHM